LETNSMLGRLHKKISKIDFPHVKHYAWEEDGKRYSSWKINTGNITINTGDEGMKLLNEAFRKEFEKLRK